MKKFYLISMMLLGVVSLFTSCVDGDYYDLYEDEEVLSPRNKKGKESNYPLNEYISQLMQAEGNENGWYCGECAACCYSNVTGKSRFDSRVDLVLAQYGICNDQSCSMYLTGVMNDMPGYRIPTNVLASALGWHINTLYDISAKLKYDIPINWDRAAVVVDGLNHVGLVTGGPFIQRYNDGYKYTLTYKDQLGSNHQCYFAIKYDGTVLTDRIDGFIMP